MFFLLCPLLAEKRPGLFSLTKLNNYMPTDQAVLLSIIEVGGYPDFSALYEDCGYQVIKTDSVRKAVKLIRQYKPEVMVAEFNFQSDFRDRTSSLETLMSSMQGVTGASVIVFYEKESELQYQRFLQNFKVFASLTFPIKENELQTALQAISRLAGGDK